MIEEFLTRRFILALTGLFTATVGAAGPVNPSKTEAPVRVACIGDSITQGFGAAKGKS